MPYRGLFIQNEIPIDSSQFFPSLVNVIRYASTIVFLIIPLKWGDRYILQIPDVQYWRQYTHKLLTSFSLSELSCGSMSLLMVALLHSALTVYIEFSSSGNTDKIFCSFYCLLICTITCHLLINNRSINVLTQKVCRYLRQKLAHESPCRMLRKSADHSNLLYIKCTWYPCFCLFYKSLKGHRHSFSWNFFLKYQF
jgi:hypothetical protein